MAETYTGQVRDGVVVFDADAPPPEGLKVRVEPIDRPDARPSEPGADPMAGTRAMLLAWARRAELAAPSLPSDLAENHDHYAHGKPRE